jgi:hypothetical protein
MQTSRIVQAVILMMIVAMAASCAASKEYTSKLFAPRVVETKDSLVTAKVLRFLNVDSNDTDKEGWVTTDIIMGRDTISKTLALDNLAKIYPAAKATTVITDSVNNDDKATSKAVFAEVKPIIVESEPVARNANPAEVRRKRTRE